jgi:hypothetical protein
MAPKTFAHGWATLTAMSPWTTRLVNRTQTSWPRWLLSADLRYSHSSGAVDTKDSLLELIGGKATRYVAYRPVARGVRFASPEIALEHGRAEVVLEKDGTRTEATLLFLAVWRLEDGSWRFLEWQSARPPAAP